MSCVEIVVVDSIRLNLVLISISRVVSSLFRPSGDSNMPSVLCDLLVGVDVIGISVCVVLSVIDVMELWPLEWSITGNPFLSAVHLMWYVKHLVNSNFPPEPNSNCSHACAVVAA